MGEMFYKHRIVNDILIHYSEAT